MRKIFFIGIMLFLLVQTVFADEKDKTKIVGVEKQSSSVFKIPGGQRFAKILEASEFETVVQKSYNSVKNILNNPAQQYADKFVDGNKYVKFILSGKHYIDK